MKFKYLMIVFIIIIIFIILITALLPLLLAGPEFAASIRYVTLPLTIFTVFLLIVMIVVFLLNYRLLSLLEREDWPALAYYLEHKIYTKGRYSARKVRLLAGSYMVISDYPSVLKLENKAAHAKPSVIEKSILLFGAARVLSGNQKEAAAFFGSYLNKGRVKERQWVRWYYGFSQLLGGVFSMAEVEFESLAASSDDALVTGLSAYFLATSIVKHSLKQEECLYAGENGRSRVIKALKTGGGWNKEADKQGSEIHITIVRKYIDEAGQWIFNTAAAEADGGAIDAETR